MTPYHISLLLTTGLLHNLQTNTRDKDWRLVRVCNWERGPDHTEPHDAAKVIAQEKAPDKYYTILTQL